MRKYTREQIASDYTLWQEYVDPMGTMTKEEFEAMTLKEALKIQVDCFGPADEIEDD